MSWAVEEWKDGLPGKALQKIHEMEVQLDKLKKERTQKQFQLDSLEAALQKQKQKVDSERTEMSALKRENQSLVESCDSLEKARQKSVHDLGVKEQQVSYLEGQLSSCRNTIERLEQDLKKYKNELDRSQPTGSSSLSSSSSEQPYPTPQKSFSTPVLIPAYRRQDNKLEELQEKYSQEMEERKRLESELKVLQVKLLNQSSVSNSHKDIAVRQAGSSIFPWQQQDQAQSRQYQDIETPLKRERTSHWDVHEETPIIPRLRMSCSRAVQSPAESSQQMKQLKTTQELKGHVSELERNLSNQEKKICSQVSKLQELQTQLNQARKELTERDKDLAKTSHELSQATDRHQQVEAKCSSLEQKLKQVTEEMSCQRHNAESCRRSLEQKLKDQERDSQKELAELQNSHQALEQQLNQTRTKLTQEIQQLKKDYSVIQANMEKKSQIEKELEEQKQKLLRSEQSLQACQNKEQDLRKKMEELHKEKNNVTVQLDESSRRLSWLEDEKKSAEQSLEVSARELENLRKALCDAEAKNDQSDNELQKLKQETERLTNRLTVIESEELKSKLTASQNECNTLKQEHHALLEWKKEKDTLIDKTETIQKELTDKISNLENSLSSLNKANCEIEKQLMLIEADKASLSAQIDYLKGELLNKSTELEEKDHQYKELQSHLSDAGQKHTRDLENVGVQVAQLETQVKDLMLRLQKEITRAEQAERTNTELQDEHQAVCALVSSKDQLVELHQAEISQLKESLAQAIAHQEQYSRLAEEKAALLKQCEESVLAKAEETEQIELKLEAAQQELLLTKNQHVQINHLLEQISCLEAKVAENTDAMEKLQILKNELEVVNQSHADLKNSLEDLEKNHFFTIEIKSNLENNLNEKGNLIYALEKKVKDLTEEKSKDSKSHALEIENLLKKEKSLQEQLEAAKQSMAAAKTELSTRREEIKTMKTTLAVASHGLEERDNTIKCLKEKLNKAEAEQAMTSHLLKEKIVAMNKIKVQLEMLQMDLEDNETTMNSFDSQVEELKATIESLETQLAQNQIQMFSMEAKLEDSKVQVSVLEARLEEVQSQNSVLEAQYVTAKEELFERSCEVTRLEEDIVKQNQLEESVAILQSKLCQITEENIKLETTLKQITDNHNQLVQEKNNLETTLRQLTDVRGQLENEIVQVNADKKQLEAGLDKLCEENKQLQTNIKQFTEEKQQTKAQFDQMTAKKNEAESTLCQVIEEKTVLEVTVSLMNKEKIEFEARLGDLTSEKHDLVSNLKELGKEMLHLEIKCNQLTQDNIKLQSSVDQVAEEKLQLQERIDSHKDEVVSLNEENECIQRSLQSSEQEQQRLKHLEMRDKQREENRNGGEQLEIEQAELHQKLALLEQAGQQHSLIQIILSESQETQKPEKKICHIESEAKISAQQTDVEPTLDESKNQLIPMICELSQQSDEAFREDVIEQDMNHEQLEGRDSCVVDIEEMEIKNEKEQLHHQQEPVDQLPADRSSGDDFENKPVCDIYLPMSSLSETKELTSCESSLVQGLQHYKEMITEQENGFQTMSSDVDLLNFDLALRKELMSEMKFQVQNLEKKLLAAEEEACGAAHKLNIAVVEKNNLADQLALLLEERETLTLQLQTAKCQLADVMEMLETMEMTKGGWNEKFLQQESELKRVRSEKANLEQHIMGMESELEILQEEKIRLKDEMETQRRTCSGMEHKIETLMTETSKLRSELVFCTEERDDLNQSLSQWREKVHSLEKTNLDTRNLISILEDDIRAGRKEYDALQSSMEKLKTERQQLLNQIKVLEQAVSQQSGERQQLIFHLNQIKEDHTSASQNTESMVSKIAALEGEVTRLSQSLESCLLEKVEIASRLSSTQDEVQQMRTGIEKLQVRIESDERKKKKMGELLRAAHRKSDALQDRIDALEREKEDIEQSLEEAVLQAEGAKAVLEEQKRKVEEEKRDLHEKLSVLSADLDNLRSEKERLEREMETKTREIEELNAAKEELERGLEEADHRQVKSISSLMAEKEQIEAEKEKLRSTLLSVEQERDNVRCTLTFVEEEKERLEQEHGMSAQEKEKLQSSLFLLKEMNHEMQETLSSLKQKKEGLEEEKQKLELQSSLTEAERENMLTALSALEKEKQRAEEEREKLREERESLQRTADFMEKELETHKLSVAQLNVQVSELTTDAAHLAKERDSALSKMNLWMKTCKQLEQEKQMMLNSSGNGKSSKEIQTDVNHVKTEAEDRKGKVEDLKMTLEERRRNAQEKNNEVEELKSALFEKRKEMEVRDKQLEEMKTELAELNSCLEDKTKEADDSIVKYCSLMVQVHKLEDTNAALKSRLELITQNQHANASICSINADCTHCCRSGKKSFSKHQEEKMDDNSENIVVLTPQGSSSGKRGHGDISDKDSAQEALHNLTKKIKANAMNSPKPRNQLDENEFRPEGLPELVQKGFADIPLGEESPFVMRRTTRRCSPRLATKHITHAPDSKVLGLIPLQSPIADSRKCPSPCNEEKPTSHSLSSWKSPEHNEELSREKTQQGDCHVQ